MIAFFDLDGTLTDSAPGILRCVHYALEKLGIDPAGKVTAEHFIGPPLAQSFQIYYGLSEAESRRALELYRERFGTVGLFENSVYDGIFPTLDRLRAAGVRMVVATGKPEIYTTRILEHFGLASYFEAMAGSLLNGEREHKIDVLRHAMQLCGLASGESCVMIGDRATDIEAGRACGMRTMGVLYGDGTADELSGADWIAATPLEIAELLLGETSRNPHGNFAQNRVC